MKRRKHALFVLAVAVVIGALIHIRGQSVPQRDLLREESEAQIPQPSSDRLPMRPVIGANRVPEKLVAPEGTPLESSPLSSFVTPDQVREGITVLRGDLIPHSVLITETAIGLAMSDRIDRVLIQSVGMSEAGAYNVRESAFQELASNEFRGESFLGHICANADFYASSAMELADKVLEYDFETDRLKEERVRQLSENLSLSDFDRLLTYSLSRAQSMSVTRADLRVYATQGRLDAEAYVTDICGSKV